MSKPYSIALKWYIVLLMIYLSARNIPLLSQIISNGIWTIGFFAIGLILMLYRIFKNPKCLAAPQTDFLLLFLLITAVSCIVNIKYGFADNIKVLAMMVLFYFLWFPLSAAEPEERNGVIRLIAVMVSCIWFVLSALSVVMYLFSVDYTVAGGLWGETNQGFNMEFMRLWGVFHDPNYAGAGCITTIFCSLYLMRTKKTAFSTVAGIINIVVQILYIVLSGSRATTVTLLCTIACYILYWSMSHAKGGALKKWAKSIGLSVCAVVAGYMFLQAVLFGMPYMQKMAGKLPDSVVKSVCSAYDAAYENSDLTLLSKNSLAIDRGLLKDLPSVQPPDTPPDNTDAVNPIFRGDSEKIQQDISNGRFLRWAQMLQIFENAPILGTSPKNIAMFARQHNPTTLMAKYNVASHNSYIDVLVSTGLVGALCMLVLMISVAIPAIKKYLMFDRDQTFILAVMIFLTQALVGFFISDLFFLFSIASHLFWISTGYMVHCAPGSKRESYVYKLVAKVLKRDHD